MISGALTEASAMKWVKSHLTLSYLFLLLMQVHN